MPVLQDGEIIHQFRDPGKREKVFQELVKKYQEKLYWQCRRILIEHADADDALQNTFIKVWNGLANFREDSGLYTWLYRIAVNESLSLLKQKKKQQQQTFDHNENDLFLSENLEADVYFDGDAAEVRLQEAILTLPEKQRIVFHMKYYEDMKYEDISSVLKTSVGALKASYHHAVKKIENYLLKE